MNIGFHIFSFVTLTSAFFREIFSCGVSCRSAKQSMAALKVFQPQNAKNPKNTIEALKILEKAGLNKATVMSQQTLNPESLKEVRRDNMDLFGIPRHPPARRRRGRGARFPAACARHGRGRRALSSYVTGASPNMSGVCSPAYVRYVGKRHTGGRRSRLNGVLIAAYRDSEVAGYPTLCKEICCSGIVRAGRRTPLCREQQRPTGMWGGRATPGAAVDARERPINKPFYAIEEPTSLNVLDLLPQLQRRRHRRDQGRGAPAQSWRMSRRSRARCAPRSIARARDPGRYTPRPEWVAALDKVAEGACPPSGPITGRGSKRAARGEDEARGP